MSDANFGLGLNPGSFEKSLTEAQERLTAAHKQALFEQLAASLHDRHDGEYARPVTVLDAVDAVIDHVDMIRENEAGGQATPLVRLSVAAELLGEVRRLADVILADVPLADLQKLVHELREEASL